MKKKAIKQPVCKKLHFFGQIHVDCWYPGVNRIKLSHLHLTRWSKVYSLRFVRKINSSPYNVILCRLEGCLARSLHAHSLQQQILLLYSKIPRRIHRLRLQVQCKQNVCVLHFHRLQVSALPSKNIEYCFVQLRE